MSSHGSVAKSKSYNRLVTVPLRSFSSNWPPLTCLHPPTYDDFIPTYTLHVATADFTDALPRQIRTESLYVSRLVMHHHHCCLAPQQCVVPVVASSRQSGRVWAIFTASVNLSLWGLRSSGTVFIHVITGRPLFQSGCRHDVLASALSGSLTLDHCLDCLGWVC